MRARRALTPEVVRVLHYSFAVARAATGDRSCSTPFAALSRCVHRISVVHRIGVTDWLRLRFGDRAGTATFDSMLPTDSIHRCRSTRSPITIQPAPKPFFARRSFEAAGVPHLPRRLWELASLTISLFVFPALVHADAPVGWRTDATGKYPRPSRRANGDRRKTWFGGPRCPASATPSRSSSARKSSPVPSRAS